MQINNQPISLMLSSNIDAASFKKLKAKYKAEGINVEQSTNGSVSPAKAKYAKGKKAISINNIHTNASYAEVNAWDIAHDVLAINTKAQFIEPDFVQNNIVPIHTTPANKPNAKSKGATQGLDNFDPDWQPNANKIWHLADTHSQLKSARDSMAHNNVIRIGHIDTGYTKHFAIQNSTINNPLQRNFVSGEAIGNAMDPMDSGLLKQPGHGTGTLGILNGGKIKITTADGVFNDYLGANPYAEVVSCRIASSVVLIKSSAFADAVNYLINLHNSGTAIHAVSMSMGGAPSKAWANAVNAAYDAGITLVTAAGNNFSGLPTRNLIFPARFGRVIAACGVTYNYAPYYTTKLNEMQGNFGPDKFMNTALAAFTPNTPWASAKRNTIDFGGAGTSSATPQIAAAASLYYQKNFAELNALPGWKRVEAIRHALFSTAAKKIKSGFSNYATYFGNGILQAHSALQVPINKNVVKTNEDDIPWFPILDTIFKTKPSTKQSTALEMLNTEIAQLVYHNASLAALIFDEQKDYNTISAKHWKKFKQALIEFPAASNTLKNYLKTK
jgi:hypothetical protein